MFNFKIMHVVWIIVLLLILFIVTQSALVLNSIYAIDNEVNDYTTYQQQITAKIYRLKMAAVEVRQRFTDISATRGQDGLGDGFNKAEGQAQLFHRLIDELVVLDAEHRQQYRAILPLFEKFYKTGRNMAQAYVDQGLSGGNAIMAEFDSATDALTGRLEPLLNKTQSNTAHVLTRLRQEAVTVRNIVVLFGVLGLVVILFTVYGIRKLIAGPIKKNSTPR